MTFHTGRSTAFPQPDATRAALARLDTLAVVDVSRSELTGTATHVLAAAETAVTPSEADLAADVTAFEITPLFDGAELARMAARARGNAMRWRDAVARCGAERCGGTRRRHVRHSRQTRPRQPAGLCR